MHRGYFALWRKIQDHEFWKEPRQFSKLEAWIDILMSAQHEEEPKQVLNGMTVMICNYGESLKSVRTWADRWGWNESKVRRFLKLLKNMGQIVFKSDGQTTRINIINYEHYDPRRQGNDDVTTHERRTSDARATTDKNDKKDKKTYTPLPPKGGNGSVLKSYVYPEWLNRVLWANYVHMRSRIKKPITTKETVDGLLENLKSLIQSHDQAEIIQSAIDGCWQSFFPPKKPGDNNRIVKPTYREPQCAACQMMASNIAKGKPCPFCGELA